MQPFDYDVIISGAGPVGTLGACLLGRYGVKVLIIDKHAAPLQIPRAIALDEETQSILDLVGVNKTLAAASPRVDTIDMQSSFLGRVFEIDGSRDKDGFARIITFYQPALEGLLLDKLKSYPSVELRRPAELTDFTAAGDCVTATIEEAGVTKNVTGRYLLGCDGAGSLVRQKLDIKFKGKCSGEDWLIVDALEDPAPDNRIRYYANPARPAVTMPGPGGRRRWEFLLHKGEAAKADSKEFLHSLLTPWGDPEAMRIERSVVYNFQSRIAARYSNQSKKRPEGNIFLLGDAAHLTPPFIGQGLCAGIRDANNLAWKINWVLKGYAGGHILKTYESERKPHTWANIRMAGLLGNLITESNRYTAAVKAAAVRSVLAVPGLGSRLQSLDLKPANKISSGLCLTSAFTRTDKLLGRQILATPNEKLGKELVLLRPASGDGKAGPVPEVWSQVGGTVAPSENQTALVVRPDKVVAATGSPASAAQVASDYSRLLRAG